MELWKALSDAEWRFIRERGVQYRVSKVNHDVVAKDPVTGRSTRGRSLCDAIHKLHILPSNLKESS